MKSLIFYVPEAMKRGNPPGVHGRWTLRRSDRDGSTDQIPDKVKASNMALGKNKHLNRTQRN